MKELDGFTFPGDEYSIKTDEFRITNDEFSLKSDEICISSWQFWYRAGQTDPTAGGKNDDFLLNCLYVCIEMFRFCIENALILFWTGLICSKSVRLCVVNL